MRGRADGRHRRPDWLARTAAFPDTLLQPVTVTDDSDGQLAHLHGLNLSRAWAWRRLAVALPAGDPRVPVARRHHARRHAEAGMPHATGGDFMVEHWLAAYALGDPQARTTRVEKILSSRHWRFSSHSGQR